MSWQEGRRDWKRETVVVENGHHMTVSLVPVRFSSTSHSRSYPILSLSAFNTPGVVYFASGLHGPSVTLRELLPRGIAHSSGPGRPPAPSRFNSSFEILALGKTSTGLLLFKSSTFGLSLNLNCFPMRGTTSIAPSLSLRQFPITGFLVINPGEQIEGGLPSNAAENFYPVHMGEVFASRYQAITKFGYGMCSIDSLCRDLQ